MLLFSVKFILVFLVCCFKCCVVFIYIHNENTYTVILFVLHFSFLQLENPNSSNILEHTLGKPFYPSQNIFELLRIIKYQVRYAEFECATSYVTQTCERQILS